jgi:hypothetical protein
MKNGKKYTWIGILSLSLLSGLAGMAVAETLVNVPSSTQNVAKGETFTINVTIYPDTSIVGAQFDLSFNASLVSAESVTEGDLLSQDGASTYFSPGIIDNAAGTITGVAGSIITSGVTVSSPGVFATIRMTAKMVDGTSRINLSNVIVGDINANAVSTTVNNGSIIIGSLCGDLNGDGNVTTADAVIALEIAAGSRPFDAAADVNGDGIVTSLDALMILQAAAGQIVIC